MRVTRPRVAIVGAGRMGQGLALALTRSGVDVVVWGRTPRALVAPLVFHGDRASAVRGAGIVLIAVPDDAIASVSYGLAQEGAITNHQVVLHLSGLLDRHALIALQPTAAGLGSFHPLQSIADPASAPERLAGSYAGIEGDGIALQSGEWLATTVGMVPVRLSAQAKPHDHAGALDAANYTVALAGMAERLARSAGLSPDIAAKVYLPLIRGTLANLDAGIAAALTGPVRRGDLETIRTHLEILAPQERQLYRALGLAALTLAREAGLPAKQARQVEELLSRE